MILKMNDIDEIKNRLTYLEQQVYYLTETLKRIEEALSWDINDAD